MAIDMNKNDILTKLASFLDKKRYDHSLGVMESAVVLAKKYDGDEYKAATAGLLHDCAKSLPPDQILKLCGKYNIILDEITLKQIGLVHGPLGAKIAEECFNITDSEILNAIKCHTTGKKGMTLLDKIIYLADYIEKGRNFPGVDKLREIADYDLNKAVLAALDNTIIYVISSGYLLHPMTLEARNDILSLVNK